MLQGGCIIRAKFLDDIKQAYQRDPALENLLMDPLLRREPGRAPGVLEAGRLAGDRRRAFPMEGLSLRSARWHCLEGVGLPGKHWERMQCLVLLHKKSGRAQHARHQHGPDGDANAL